MFKPGGWSVEDLRKNMKGVFGTKLEPFGLMKTPYPFYGGVKVERASERSAGIVSYGAYVPPTRLSLAAIGGRRREGRRPRARRRLERRGRRHDGA